MTAPAPVPADLPALRIAGHFGEFLQGRVGGVLALVSVPCPALTVAAWLEPGAPSAREAAFLAGLGLPAPPGRPVFAPQMPPGGGAGSSTASLVALARLAGWNGPPQALARACVAAEGASDPLMFPHPARLLFAPREGRVLAELPPPPGCEIVGGFLGPDTPTDPADQDFPDIADLVAGWRAAPDLATRAALAAESAARTLALRGPAGDPTAGLARAEGALGWLIAHTGSARGLIFAPGTAPGGLEARLAARGFRQVLRFEVGG